MGIHGARYEKNLKNVTIMYRNQLFSRRINLEFRNIVEGFI